MASTFSPTLRLELIGDGDQSGIWGQTTNTNLGTLLEQAITGVVSITMLDANYTLTSFNGVSDEARNAVLVVGGTNSQVRDIIAPLAEKLYVVRNSTSGGFAINIRAATGSSVSVPSGATVWVYCDGTNFNAINTESVGNFEVNGNLTVTGNTNAVAATYTGNVAALNLSTANLTATGNVSAANFSTAGNATAANFIGAGLTLTSINASNISAGTIANARTTAASANGASTIVARDANGSFAGNVITATLFSGSGASLTNIPNSATTASSANGASTIVARDANGSFSANVGNFVTVTGAHGGNGSGLTDLNASNITTGTISNARTTGSASNGASTIVLRDANGSFAGNVITATTLSGALTASTGTFSGAVTFNGGINSSPLFRKQNTVGEGGELQLEKSDTSTLAGNLLIDLVGNSLRIFEGGGTARGVALDISAQSAGAAGALLTNTNFNSYSPTLTGTGASGTWGINVTGTASTVTNATQNSITSAPNLSTVGTISSGTWNATLGSVSGASLTNLNASNLASGTVGTARLASGTANSTTFLRGDQTWAVPSASIAIANDNSTNATFYPTMTTATSGNVATQTVSSAKLGFNPLSGLLTTYGGFKASSTGPFFMNDNTVSVDYTIPANVNAGSYGPITINNGITVTVTTDATWTIV